MKRTGLGKGLNALLPDNSYYEETSDIPLPPVEPEGDTLSFTVPASVLEIPLDSIETNPFQPRTEFDPEALAELADSIRMHGIIQPITVRKLSEGQYQLISGERRWQASRIAGLTTVPAYVRTADDEQMLEFALIENIQRQDLNPIEIAIAYQRLADECRLTIEQVSEKVGKKRPTVNNYMRLLKLPTDIQAGLKQNLVSMGHARALLGADNPVIQSDIFRNIIEKDLSVRQTEELVRQIGTPAPVAQPVPKTAADPKFEIQIRDLTRELSNRFSTKVVINTDAEGKGEIKFSFFSGEDLNRLLELMQ